MNMPRESLYTIFVDTMSKCQNVYTLWGINNTWCSLCLCICEPPIMPDAVSSATAAVTDSSWNQSLSYQVDSWILLGLGPVQ